MPPSEKLRFINQQTHNPRNDPRPELTIVQSQLKLNPHGGPMNDNSWNDSAKMIGEKYYDFFFADKNKRDHDTAKKITKLNQSDINKKFIEKKEQLEHVRLKQKELMDQRRLERVALTKQAHQPILENGNNGEMIALHLVEALEKTDQINLAVNRSALHTALHTKNDNLWNNHASLDAKHIKKNYTSKIIALQEKAVERITGSMLKEEQDWEDHKENRREDIKGRFEHARDRRAIHMNYSKKFTGDYTIEYASSPERKISGSGINISTNHRTSCDPSPNQSNHAVSTNDINLNYNNMTGSIGSYGFKSNIVDNTDPNSITRHVKVMNKYHPINMFNVQIGMPKSQNNKASLPDINFVGQSNP